MSEIRAPGQRVRSFYEARLKMFYRNRVDTTRASDKITYYLLIDGIGQQRKCCFLVVRVESVVASGGLSDPGWCHGRNELEW